MKQMKTLIVTLAALLITISISAQQTIKQTETKQVPVELINESDTLQYALGAFIGQWMVKNGFEMEDIYSVVSGLWYCRFV